MISALFVVYMACAYRYRGGWRLGTRFDSPRWLELLAVSWPMAFVVAAAAWADGIPTRLDGLAPIVLVLTMGAHSIGHGNAMNMGRRPYTGLEDAEIWDVVAGPLIGETPYGKRWKRDAIALTLSGLVVGLPTALALVLMGHTLSALVWLVAGASKVIAYEIGWQLHKDGSWRQGTEIGEVLFGAFLGLAVAVTV